MVEETLLVPASVDHLPTLHTALERFWRAVDGAPVHPPTGAWRAALATAVIEIGGNIIRHAYPPGDRPGWLCLRLRLYADRVEARFGDRGRPYLAPPCPPAPADPLDLPEGGYGLPLARASVDRLNYRHTPGGLNRWYLIKHLSDAGGRSGQS